MITINLPKIRNYQNKYVLAFGIAILAFLLLILLWPSAQKSFEKTQIQVESLAESIRQHYNRQPNYWGLDTATALQKGIIEPQMNRNGKIISALGKELLIGGDSLGNAVSIGSREFVVTIPEISAKACRYLAAAPMSDSFKAGLLKIVISTDNQTQTFEWGGENTLPIDKEKAAEICGKTNALSWFFE